LAADPQVDPADAAEWAELERIDAETALRRERLAGRWQEKYGEGSFFMSRPGDTRLIYVIGGKTRYFVVRYIEGGPS
jgi:hypothetical protein